MEGNHEHDYLDYHLVSEWVRPIWETDQGFVGTPKSVNQKPLSQKSRLKGFVGTLRPAPDNDPGAVPDSLSGTVRFPDKPLRNSIELQT